MPKFNFPKIEKVIIRNFSLYTKDNIVVQVEEDINNGVYCLAGANGLGKTTFLNSINYGLTGIVLEPGKSVFIPDQIIKFNKSYTERYFNGRIKSNDKPNAEIELLLQINGKYIRIIRKFVNREELKVFEFYNIIDGKKNILNNECKNNHDRLKAYEKIISDEIGFNNFDYYIFFQLYVLTFDENRTMLFWDPTASTSALSIAFSDNMQNTDRVLDLKKQMDELESYGRNTRWQAKQIKNELERLLKHNQNPNRTNIEELKAEYFQLHEDLENKDQIFNDINIEYDTLLKRQNIVNSEILHLKINYKKLFAQYSEPRSSLVNNPILQLAKNDNKCFLCHAEGHQVIENIEKKLFSQDTCPACDTVINNGNVEEQNNLLVKIKEIDKELDFKNKLLENLLNDSDTKKIELDKSEIEKNFIRKKIIQFEKENDDITFDKTGDAPLDTIIEQYQRQFEKYDKDSKDYYKERDKLKPEYDNLIEKVNQGYKETEEVFVPLFKHFAYSFIGLDLKIYPKPKGRNFTLYFEMKETARTASHQLSESQRFFLDIALRMALAVHLSSTDFGATLLIDTPEGSLDIAYENRVGKMFADFVTRYHQNIVMTANINASQLLVSLAEHCGTSKMKFRRMLEWTDLSEIQKEGEYLFDGVYSNIEKKLKEN